MNARMLTVLFLAALERCAALSSFEPISDAVPTPRAFLPVAYVDGRKVALGSEMTPTQVKDSPVVTLPDRSKGNFYMLCMVDVDAPSRQEPRDREWLHWLVVNIPGDEVQRGSELAEYVGAQPGRGTGLHRYVLLLYKQRGQADFDEPYIPKDSREGRPKFSCDKFAEKYKMLRPPVGGNYFTAKWDELVSRLQKQLG